MDEEAAAKGQVEGTAETDASTAPAESQPGFQVPEGKHLIDEAELTRFRNLENTHKGLAPIGHAAINAKFTTEADIQEARSVMDRLRENNIDPAKLTTLFSPDATNDPDPDARFTQMEERFNRLETETAVSRALPTHQSAVNEAALAKESALKELLGDDATPRDKALFEALYDKQVGAQLYPEKHPLRDLELAPADKSRSEAAVKTIREMLNMEAAKEVLETGRAATKPSGGTRSGQGGADKSDKPPTDPFDMSAEQKLKAANDILAKHKAKTGRSGAVSSLEG